MAEYNTSNIDIKIKRKIGITILLALFLDLLFVYISKYSHKNLSLSEFNPYYMGNILNFLFFIMPATGLIRLIVCAGKYEKRNFTFLLILTVLMNIPLLISFISSRYNLHLPVDYMLGYPIDKIFIAGLFSAFQCLLFMLTSSVWLYIFYAGRHVIFLSVLYAVLVVFLAANCVFLYTSIYYDETDYYYSSNTKSDVAVILGAAVWSKSKPSPIFASRIAKASNLYNSGAVRKIQVTGGSAPGERSEADVAYHYLRKIGIEAGDIWIERRTASTAEQVEFIKEKLVKERHLKSIIIVSDGFHLKRVMEMCSFYNVKADGVASGLPLSWAKSVFYRFRDSMALLIFWLFAL